MAIEKTNNWSKIKAMISGISKITLRSSKPTIGGRYFVLEVS